MMKALDLNPGQYVLQATGAHVEQTYSVNVWKDHTLNVKVHVHRDGPSKPHVQYRLVTADGKVEKNVIKQLRKYVASGATAYAYEPWEGQAASAKPKKLAFKPVEPELMSVKVEEVRTPPEPDYTDREIINALELSWDFVCKHDERNPYLTEPGKSVRDLLDKMRGGK